MSDFPITLICISTVSNKMGTVHTKDQEYRAREIPRGIIVKDDFDCLRTFYGEWQKDKTVLEIFRIKEVEDDGSSSMHSEGDH